MSWLPPHLVFYSQVVRVLSHRLPSLIPRSIPLLTFVVDRSDNQNPAGRIGLRMIWQEMGTDHRETAELAASITRRASLQTFLTIQLLVDRAQVGEALRAYAYFRWLDDCLDERLEHASERLALVDREQSLIDDCYEGRRVTEAAPEERMLVDLVRAHPDPDMGVARYVRNMMAVMAFDSQRRGRLITRDELETYTHALAVAITEALHHFLGRQGPVQPAERRYHLVTAAHISHMLRDTWIDNGAGYFNVPLEELEANRISPSDVCSEPYREWVRQRVESARECFRLGRLYMAEVESVRYRLAADAYAARFLGVLDTIERAGYLLQRQYTPRRSVRGALGLCWGALSTMLQDLNPAPGSGS